jgi:hypothetical protein
LSAKTPDSSAKTTVIPTTVYWDPSYWDPSYWDPSYWDPSYLDAGPEAAVVIASEIVV